MRHLVYYILLVISGICLLCTCSNGEKKPTVYEEFNTLDLGKGTYRPNPFPFLDNLPPFSWMGMPDSVKLRTTLQISFNEDAIRSNSSAKIAFVDNNGELVQGLTYDGHDVPFAEINASACGYDQVALVPIEITVNPSLGKTQLNGSIIVFDADVDAVNQEQLSSSSQSVASWSLTQNIGINWLRWLLFIIEIGIVLALIYMIGWLLFTTIGLLKNSALSISSTSKSFRNNHKDKRIKKRKEDIIKVLLRLEERLYSNLMTYCKYDILEEMRSIIQDLYEKEPATYSKAKEALNVNTWDAYEEACKIWDPVPKNNVDWIGYNKQECVLKSTHPSYQICKALNFIKCNYDKHGSPNFSSVTYPNSLVNITDLYDTLTIDNIKKRGGSKYSLQEMAQERMAQQLQNVVYLWAKQNNCEPDFYKWRDALNLVPHEDTNCRTMRLVNRDIHTAFKHRGGVANAVNIKKHFS